jgi:arginyl-tRNA synthetase
MQHFADALRAAVAAAAEVGIDTVRLEAPRDEKQGDLAVPCFLLAKARGIPPPAMAAKLAAALGPGGPQAVAEVTASAAGPYLNFRIARPALAQAVFAEIAAVGARYGGSSEGAGKRIVIDFSSPNIAKPMHVGHIRSTILGAALTRIFSHLGYTTVGINHIGDWGAQFGGLVVAIRRWRGEVDLEREPVRGLLDLYQRSKAAVESDPAFHEEAVAAYRELESGREGPVRETWRWVTAVSMRGFEATYKRLGIEHDLVRGESYYENLMEPTIQRIVAAGITEISEGALIVQLSTVDKGLKETPCLLRQTNGTTLYATRDLAAMFQRFEEFGFERCLYVVGSEQRLHFRQLKAVLKRLELPWEPRVEHVDFGLLLGPGRVKLASRKGAVLVLDDLIDEVVDEARRIIQAKNPDLAQADQVAEAVGIGAIVFNDLKRERVRDVVFDKSEILSFEGETGPYLQYTHARLASILRKANANGEGTAEPDWSVLENAGPILMRLARLGDVVRGAAVRAEPSEISNYLLALARDLNSWYVENRVLGEAPGVTGARLALIRASKSVLGNGLGLLGIRPLEAM